jgi:hypothetical protein
MAVDALLKSMKALLISMIVAIMLVVACRMGRFRPWRALLSNCCYEDDPHGE